MTSKHTPGPWSKGKCYGHTRVEIVGDAGNRMVASVVDTKSAYNRATDKNELVQCEEGEANARLIAAAPELLEALIRARRCIAWACEQRSEFHIEYGLADAAIAKATGAA